MSVASLAATVTPAKKVTADTTSTTTSSGASLMGLTGVTLTSVGCPAAHFGMGGWSLDVGGTIANAANTTTLTLLARGNIPLSKISNGLSTYWGPAVLYNSAGSGTTTITVLVGAEYVFAPNLSLFADLTAFSLTSANGATTWFAGANAGQIYSGGRLYL
ncbi:MAG: hypothetical protein JW873_07360 [Candidatus Saganbacteria bacterium]|nr:hypothetical protein [Candidatus Saganbacteria bacterium]